MADVDWKKLVGTVAPTLSTMLLGPLAGTAVSALSNVFFGVPDKTESEVAQAVQNNLTPELMIEIKKLDKEHEEKMAEFGLDYAKLNQSLEVAYISDTADARKYHTDNTFKLGVAILVTFAIIMTASLYGAYMLLTGGMKLADASIVAAVSGFIGTIVGYVAANAQQVVSYFYGSSAGSKAKTDALAESVKNVIR